MSIAQIVTKFCQYHSDLHKEMRVIDHSFRGEGLNPFHQEGTIWAHTSMVLNEAKDASVVQKLAALCHDIGKIDSVIDQENGRRSFRNHEAISTFYAKDVLESFDITLEQKRDVMFIVANHGSLYQFFTENGISEKNIAEIQRRYPLRDLELLFEFYKYDHQGRIASDDFDTYDDVEDDMSLVLGCYVNPTRIANFFKDSGAILLHNPNVPKLIVLIGSPRSGKSTWVSRNHRGEVIVSRDDELLKYAKEKGIEGNYSGIWSKLTNDDQTEIDRRTNKTFQDARKAQRDIIIDKTNMSKKSRKQYIQAKRYNKIAIIFIESKDTCLKRNSSGKTISKEVMQNMQKRFVWPDYSEFDEITIAT